MLSIIPQQEKLVRRVSYKGDSKSTDANNSNKTSEGGVECRRKQSSFIKNMKIQKPKRMQKEGKINEIGTDTCSEYQKS